ncbi:MAG: hypothetical protein B0A82_22140 [Alkalinema sp. CACIAM 70d]|nr:MAG: hypothetical protein B0A82_22140 [Alkalinema sp. CACIAM 70d]
MLIGIDWGYDGAAELGTPPRLYNQIIQIIAIARNNSTDQNVRLFALINATMGDAGIMPGIRNTFMIYGDPF